MSDRMIEVKAGTMRDGTPLIVFIPRRIKAGVGATCYQLKGTDTVMVNRDERFVIRSLRNKDLIMVQGNSKPDRPPKPRTSKAPKSTQDKSSDR